MTLESRRLSLQEGMQATGMDYYQLWLRYLAVSGSGGPLEVEAYVLGVLTVDSYEHDLIAQALNEWFIDRGQDHPVGYWQEPAG